MCRGGRFSEADAIVVIRQVLSIVAFCHQQGVVHRDLKPEVGTLAHFNTWRSQWVVLRGSPLRCGAELPLQNSR